MVGPAMTFASTGNIYHAGLSLTANHAIEKETGMSTTEIVNFLIEESKNNSNREEEIIRRELLILVISNYEKTRKIISRQPLLRSNYEKTRKKILNQNQSKTKVN